MAAAYRASGTSVQTFTANTTAQVPAPASTVAGDYLLLQVVRVSGTGTVSAPTGATTHLDSNLNARVWLFGLFATTSGAQNVALPVGTSSTGLRAAQVHAFSGLVSPPLSGAALNGSTFPAPVTTVNDALIYYTGVTGNTGASPSWSAVTGATATTPDASINSAAGIRGWYAVQATAGQSPTRTVTSNPATVTTAALAMDAAALTPYVPAIML